MKEVWDQRFSADEYVYGTEPNVFFKEKLATLVPGRILLPAEGEGRNAVYAAGEGWQVEAFDQSEAGRRKALNLAHSKNVTIQYELGDLLDLSYEPATFDCIALLFVHTDETVRNGFHQSLVGLLKPGGTLILEGFSKEQIDYASGGPKLLPLLFDLEGLAVDFQDLQVVQLEKVNYEIDEGPLHRGTASVVRLVATKP
jgi:SAM-dependent methyltransferase